MIVWQNKALTGKPTGPATIPQISTSIPPGGKGKLPPVDAQKGNQQTEEILNSILPPREWTEGGQLWVQSVSSTPATRLDVVNLQVKQPVHEG